MNKQEKDAAVVELHEKLVGVKAFYLTDFSRMSVKQITAFRSRLRKQGVEYVVVKNTLAQRALADLELPDIGASFAGPTGLVIGRTDAVAAAKVLSDFSREHDNKPGIKLGIVEGLEVGPAQIKELAELPPREVLLARLAGDLQAPMSRLAGGMYNLVAGLARAIDALRQQREEAGT
jgi:large subunit ribosomal protein L10